MIAIPEKVDASTAIQDEGAFKHAWQSTAEQPDILSRAFAAGLVSDRLAWVFIAGYQSALRSVFKNLPDTEWWAFAASEDGSGELPGVSVSNGRLNGVKTWVATCEHVDGIIVTADRACYRMRPQENGAELNSYPSAEFLGDMSVGKLELNDATAGEPVTMQGDFGLAEPTFLVAASCGYLLREACRLGLSDIDEQVRPIVGDLSQLFAAGYETDIAELLRIYRLVSDLGKTCGMRAAELNDGSATDWSLNGRLLSLYKRGLAGRIEA